MLGGYGGPGIRAILLQRCYATARVREMTAIARHMRQFAGKETRMIGGDVRRSPSFCYKKHDSMSKLAALPLVGVPRRCLAKPALLAGRRERRQRRGAARVFRDRISGDAPTANSIGSNSYNPLLERRESATCRDYLSEPRAPLVELYQAPIDACQRPEVFATQAADPSTR